MLFNIKAELILTDIWLWFKEKKMLEQNGETKINQRKQTETKQQNILKTYCCLSSWTVQKLVGMLSYCNVSSMRHYMDRYTTQKQLNKLEGTSLTPNLWLCLSVLIQHKWAEYVPACQSTQAKKRRAPASKRADFTAKALNDVNLVNTVVQTKHIQQDDQVWLQEEESVLQEIISSESNHTPQHLTIE